MQKLLLLHGAIGAQDHLEPLADLLSTDFDIFRFNFSGHGGQPMNATFSIAQFADEVNRFLEQENVSDITVFGYSMGGYVAMYLAKHYPGRVNKIITLATKFHWDESTAEKEIKMLNAEKIEEKLPAFAASLQKRHAPNDWKNVLNETAAMLTAMGQQNPLSLENYADIHIPCLLLIGDRDKMISLDETINVYKALPLAQMGMLPNTHHPIEQVNKEALTFMVTQFMNAS